MPATAGKQKKVVRKKRTTAVAKSTRTAVQQKASHKPARKGNAPLKARAAKRPGIKAPLPKDIQPMLATLVDKPPEAPGWSYEIKWDGYRALAYIDKQRVDLRSRNNKIFNDKYYPVYEALQQWKVRAVVDGEIIVANEKGISDFNHLQNWRSEADGELLYYLFDLLWLDGYDIMNMPLQYRREQLRSIVPPHHPTIVFSENFEAGGAEVFDAARRMGLEGILAKKTDSPYIPGARSKAWLKIKIKQRQDVVIGGYTKNENTSRQFSALLLGIYENGVLQYVGPVGTGFTDNMQTEILQKLKPLITSRCPFAEVPDYNKPSRFRPHPPKATVTWVKPRLVGEISYHEITRDGAIRHPSFERLRQDKDASTVVREKPASLEKMIPQTNAWRSSAYTRSTGKKERKTLLNPTEKTQVKQINGHQVKFTNLNKIYWPNEKVMKRDMLNYYYQVAPFMLPYMKDRPQTLNRFPNGINGKSFYQKDITGKVPEWIVPFPYYSEQDSRQKHFLVCTDEASLLYIASMGCIEMNPWSSRMQKPDHPDWCIIDLDPTKKNPFTQVIETALVTKQVLDTFHLPSCCKTSGSTGLHIYIPLGAKYTYEESKEFGRLIAKVVHRELPSFTSIERYTQKRKDKLYIDFLQNRPQATVAGPYSLRPKPGAPVSAPLHWEEVKKGLNILDFTIFNMTARLKETGDLFQPALKKGIDLPKAMKLLEKEITG
jgi:bifunctional non-homologous end joining protein LigD